jgi:4,5:9,10-diseco-3-hydroxy-5,9,17-trioxoandrosta-1(10),2-diene-4-oate hydrolase
VRLLLNVVALVIAATGWFGCTREAARIDVEWSRLVDEHRHDVDVDGLSMHYIDLGVGDPLVMIHGIGDSTYSWHQNAKALVDAGFRVVLVDQPGFGRSGIPSKGWAYSVENQAGAVLQVVNRLGIDRFQLVGHSLGGGEALYLAWTQADRLPRVAVISPACQRASCPFGVMTDLVAGTVGTRWFTAHALRSAFFRPERVSDVMIDEYVRLLDRPGRMGSGVLGGVCKEYFSPEYDRMTEHYGDLKPELLIVWGRQDTWHPVTFGTKLRSLVPASHLEVIPDAGHNVQQEAPDVVNPLLVKFFRGRR